MSEIVRKLLWLAAGLGACSYYDASLLAPSTEQEPPASTAQGGEGGQGGEDGQGGTATAFPTGGGGGPGGKGNAGAAGIAQGGSAGEAPVQPCSIKPPPPSDLPSQKKDGTDISLAIKAIDLGQGKIDGKPAYLAYGFDLDGYCSCPEDFSCKGSDPQQDRYCDGPGGRDNAGGAFFFSLAQVAPAFGTASFNQGLTKGKFGLLFRVKDYNGESDDEQVQVEWYSSSDFGKGLEPLWDGSDAWPVEEDSYLDIEKKTPRYTDPFAYVTGGKLVATLPGGRLLLNNILLDLVGPVLVAGLTPPDATSPLWRVQEGILAARWRSQDILAQLAYIPDPLDNKPLCKSNPLYGTLKAQICSYADISSTVQGQINAPCDALAIAIKFDAVQANIGVPSTKPTVNPCLGADDPKGDTCELP